MAEKRVLVADDEPSLLHLVSLRLRRAGYEVLTASNGREALEKAQREHPDLVVTDYLMPGLSGLELCQKLRHDPKTADIPAIVLTVKGYDVEPHDSRQSGVRRMLDKPFVPRDLLASVSEVLDKPLLS